jgi:hypothetical protein
MAIEITELSELRPVRLQRGFGTIIALLNEKQQPPRYDTKKMKTIGFKRYSISMADGTAPTPTRFKNILEIIDKALPAGRVLVHCQGGSAARVQWRQPTGFTEAYPQKRPSRKSVLRIQRLSRIQSRRRALYKLEATMKGRN